MKTRRSGAVPAGDPALTVVVPTRDRPEQLRDLLRALRRQTLPAERFEVIVVNDAGDPVDEIAASFRDDLSLGVLSLTGSCGCSGAREAGVREARGELLVFTDDDCVPGPGWLEALAEAHRAAPTAGLGGPVRNGRTDSPLAEALQFVVNRFTAEENAFAGRPVYFPTNNVAFPRAAYVAAGGLDPAWRNAGGEDRDLCSRWVAEGNRMVSVPAAAVEHCPVLTFRGFVRKFFHYGRGAVLHARRNGHFRSRWARVWLAVSLPLRPLRSRSVLPAMTVSLLVLVSQLCTAAGLLSELAAGGRDRNTVRGAGVEVGT